eukprot:7619510-Pyramimonas_sp.AAC.1
MAREDADVKPRVIPEGNADVAATDSAAVGNAKRDSNMASRDSTTGAQRSDGTNAVPQRSSAASERRSGAFVRATRTIHRPATKSGGLSEAAAATPKKRPREREGGGADGFSTDLPPLGTVRMPVTPTRIPVGGERKPVLSSSVGAVNSLPCGVKSPSAPAISSTRGEEIGRPSPTRSPSSAIKSDACATPAGGEGGCGGDDTLVTPSPSKEAQRISRWAGMAAEF